ncbi:MAG: hypothetical protein K6D97_06115 [Clostridia bacterium]|nr:hypothetical protein [Clostridia bacterium]
MKEKIKTFVSSKYFEWGVFIILETILFLLVNPKYRDDAIFALSFENGKSLMEVMKFRYSTWSSRSIIEIILIIYATNHKIFWQVSQIFIMWLLAYSISKLFSDENNKRLNNILIFTLILTYPMFNFSAAGWEATTINYIWPMALGLFSFISIKKLFNGKKISMIKYILYSISIVFACNMEQMGIVILFIYLVYGLIYLCMNKKIHPFFVVQIVISILSLVFIFTCKGNFVRQQAEISNYLDYPQLSLLDKLGMCFTSTMNDYINWYAIPITIICVILPIFIFSNYKETFFRIVSLIPIMILLPLKYCSELFLTLFPDLEGIKKILMTRAVTVNCNEGNNIYAWASLIISIVFFASIFVNLILFCKDLNKNNVIIMYIIGAMSKFMLVFTSSIFASAPRTIIYFDFSIYIIVFLVMKEMIKNNNKAFNRTLMGLQVVAIYQYIANIIFIINGLQ